MLDVIRRGQRWVTALFVIGIGGAMVFFIGLGGPLQGGNSNDIVRVGAYQFGYVEFNRERAQREQQYRDALGDGFDADALRKTLDEITVRALVDRALLALAAESLGISVSQQELERSVLNWGAFRDSDGRFDRETFENWAQYEYGTQRGFITDQRMRLMATKMARLLYTNARVSDGEARQAVERRLEEVKIAFVTVEPGDRSGDEIEAEAVASLLATRDNEVRTLYGERSDRYDIPEQVRARHILLRLDADANDELVETTRARAEDLVKSLREGADFADLAAETSDDPGSRENGGDLGFFERGRMVPAFESAAFSLEPGTVGDPVRSDFGYHVIRVEEHKQAQQQSYESVREELARELLVTEANQSANRALAEELATSVRAGNSLEDSARAAGMTLERTDWIRRRPDGFVPGLGVAQGLLATAFSLEAGQSSDRIFPVDDRLAMVQVLELKRPEAEDVDPLVSTEQEKLVGQKRNTQTEAWMDTRRAQLSESGDLYVNLELIR
jgi:peptidyl-prolyl cis-trans isomerase D